MRLCRRATRQYPRTKTYIQQQTIALRAMLHNVLNDGADIFLAVLTDWQWWDGSLFKVNGLWGSSKPLALSKYQQIQISASHTFGGLLYLHLDKHKVSETLSELDILDIIWLNIKVQHQNKNDGVQIDANIGASCIGLKLAGNHFVHY
jgi:hypothetical protein